MSQPRKILVLQGPNLNLLGDREPEVYGTTTLADIHAELTQLAVAQGVELKALQSNYEGELIDAIHQARSDGTVAIIINPAALTHTSVALLDALNAFSGRVIEVHLSQIHRREAFRHHSYVAQRADGILMGLGAQGYTLALQAVLTELT